MSLTEPTFKHLRCRPPYDVWECTHCDHEIHGEAPPQTSMGLVCRDCLDAGRGPGEPFIPLVFGPRKPAKTETRQIIALSGLHGDAADCILEETGERITGDEFIARIGERPQGRGGAQLDQLAPAIIVTDDVNGWACKLQDHFGTDEFFQVCAVGRERVTRKMAARKTPRTPLVDFHAVRFGWVSRRNGRRRAHGRARMFLLIDPHHFSPEQARLYAAENTAGDTRKLLQFGQEVRGFCNAHQLRVESSAGAIAAQLLRDPRFWPAWRRKIPAACNRRARQNLPGNHNQLVNCEQDRRYPAMRKLDMASAHHHLALGIEFPLSATCQAAGFFHGNLPDDGDDATGWPGIRGRKAFRRGHPFYSRLWRHRGMFLIVLNLYEKASKDPLALRGHQPATRICQGRTYRYVFSPEIPELLERQKAGELRIECVIASWSSPDVDEGVNEYAMWALEVRAQPGNPSFVKPMLLAAYGMLAARPRAHQSGYSWSTSRRQIGIRTSQGELILHHHEGVQKESPTANVLWRALIEAEQRARVLAHARELRAQGFKVAAIYADAIFLIEDGRDPPAPMPWRDEGIKHNIVFTDSTHYGCDEEARTPGLAGKHGETPQDRIRRFKAAAPGVTKRKDTE